LDLLHRKKCGKVSCHKCHIVTIMSHDECGKVVHRSYSSCISSVENLIRTVMNIEWDYNYYQPWSDNEWLVDKMLAMLDEDIIMQ